MQGIKSLYTWFFAYIFRVEHQFGPGLLTHLGTPLIKGILEVLRKDPAVITKWVRMFLRYYNNWENEGLGRENLPGQLKKRGALGTTLVISDALGKLFSPLTRAVAWLLEPLAGAINPLTKALHPLIELILRASIKMEPVFKPLIRWMTDVVKHADASIFDDSK
jgi:hypothetical protein